MVESTRRSLLGLIVITAFGAACSKKPSTSNVSASKPSASEFAPEKAKPPTALKLALNWVPEPEFGGFYAAREEGDFKKENLEVEILGGGAGVPVLQMVATGRADFGTVGGDEVVTSRARGADVVAVFATFQTNPQGIMVHAARKLTRIEQAFQSGTLAIETGIYYANYLKQKFAWGAKIVPYDGGVARFLADPQLAQQCYVTSEPLAAKRQGGDPQVFLIADTGYNPYATVVVTRRELLAKQPETVRAFVRAAAQGWQSYLRDPGPTNKKLGELNKSMDAQSLSESAAAQKPLMETEDTKTAGLGSMKRERWEQLATQLFDLKAIPEKPNVDQLFVNVATP